MWKNKTKMRNKEKQLLVEAERQTRRVRQKNGVGFLKRSQLIINASDIMVL